MRIRYIDEECNEQIKEVVGYSTDIKSFLNDDGRLKKIKRELPLFNKVNKDLLSCVIDINGCNGYTDTIDIEIPFYLSDGFIVDENTAIHLVYVRTFSICSKDFENIDNKSCLGTNRLQNLLEFISRKITEYNKADDKYDRDIKEYNIASKYVKNEYELIEPHAPSLGSYIDEIENKIRENEDVAHFVRSLDDIVEKNEYGWFDYDILKTDLHKTELLEKGYLDLTTLPSRVYPESKSRIVGYIVRR